MLGDMCLAMGTIAEGCKTLGLINEEEYDLVKPKPTQYPYVRYLYLDENEETDNKFEKTTVDWNDSATAYLTAPLVILLDREITKHQHQLEGWDRNSCRLILRRTLKPAPVVILFDTVEGHAANRKGKGIEIAENGVLALVLESNHFIFAIRATLQ